MVTSRGRVGPCLSFHSPVIRSKRFRKNVVYSTPKKLKKKGAKIREIKKKVHFSRGTTRRRVPGYREILQIRGISGRLKKSRGNRGTEPRNAKWLQIYLELHNSYTESLMVNDKIKGDSCSFSLTLLSC